MIIVLIKLIKILVPRQQGNCLHLGIHVPLHLELFFIMCYIHYSHIIKKFLGVISHFNVMLCITIIIYYLQCVYVYVYSYYNYSFHYYLLLPLLCMPS